MEETKTIFESLDWVVLGLYFAILVGVAVWVALQKNKNTEDYFLAGRNVGWFVIGDDSIVNWRYKWTGEILEGLVEYRKLVQHLVEKKSE